VKRVIESSAGCSSARHSRPLPAGACDAHVHVFGPIERYPIAAHRPAERSYAPPELGVDDYLRDPAHRGLERLVLVQPNAYGSDHRCLLDALRNLGRRARGVVVVPVSTGTGVLRSMHAAGVRGARFHEFDAATLDALPAFAGSLQDLGWHIEMYLPLQQIAHHAPLLCNLPCPVVFDHFGGLRTDEVAGRRAFDSLVRLLVEGPGWLKLSAPYRATHADSSFDDLAPYVDALLRIAPHRLLWGSDWPHLRVAPLLPRADALLDVLGTWVKSQAQWDALLRDNPARLYGFAR
jgi:predicted TIM-barrel fold metal-dependent hydrolase